MQTLLCRQGGNINTIYTVYLCIPVLSDSCWSIHPASTRLPHLLVIVLLECRLPVTLLPFRPLLLLLFGLRGQHELLRYLLLRDELGDGTRLPVREDRRHKAGGKRENGRDRLMRGKIAASTWLHASAPPLSRANNRCQCWLGWSCWSVLNTGSKWQRTWSAFRIKARIQPPVWDIVCLRRLVLVLWGIKADELRSNSVNTTVW